MAEPNPNAVAPWYLRNIDQALELDTNTGQVHIRTNVVGGNITIPGNITVSNVFISGIGNIPVSGNTMPVSGNITVAGNVNANVTGSNVNANVTGGNVTVSGNVGISTLPAISGNVNANITGGNVNAAVTGTVTANQGTSPWIVSGNVNAAITSGNITASFGQGSIDAFGRLRVSEPYTLFDSALNGERRNDFSTSATGGGNVTFNYNANVRQLNVTSANGDSVIRESMNVFPYQPGKSMLVMNSFVMNQPKTNLRQRIGFFTTNNGIYFEQNNTTKTMVIRSYSSGSVTEERVNQSSWNGDKLDGTGPSGITLDLTAPQILFTDIEWLGVGTVRVGFIINGQFITCHYFNHANINSFTTTYMSTATLPVRVEITNTGATSGNSTMQHVCSTVISEGGYNNAYYTYFAGTDINTTRLVTAGTYYPIASVRLQSGYLNSIVTLHQVDILSPSVNYYRWVILKNATLTGATWASASSTTRTQADTAATAVTGGSVVQSGYASSRTTETLSNDYYGTIGRTLAGVSDTYTLAIAATANNADVLAQLGWQEIV